MEEKFAKSTMMEKTTSNSMKYSINNLTKKGTNIIVGYGLFLDNSESPIFYFLQEGGKYVPYIDDDILETILDKPIPYLWSLENAINKFMTTYYDNVEELKVTDLSGS